MTNRTLRSPKTFLGVLGLAILAIGVALGVTLIANDVRALLLDDRSERFGIVLGDPPCSWTAEIADRVMSENDTRALKISTKSVLQENCKSLVRITAPGFTLNPRVEEQTLSVPPGREGSIVWILSSNRTGSYEVAVTDGLTSQTLGVQVTDVLGLTAAQAKVLSLVGSIFGPMCTLPWWMDKFLQRRKSQNKQAKSAPESE